MGSLAAMFKNIFNTSSPTSLKECYQALLFFAMTNFILLIFWAINPFEWDGLASILFDVFMIIYGIIMMLMVTSTLIRRFVDASIHPYQAISFPIVMMAIFVMIRLRTFSEIVIIIMLSIYFLSHFYLMMLVMMPTVKKEDNQKFQE